MVFCFLSNVVQPEAILYMGEDKHCNEELLKYAWPEDVWFHVDNLSSAHVYLRLKADQCIDDVAPELISDCAQLVKANSIKGNKLNNVSVVYTMCTNLKKTGSMDVGQVGFVDNKLLRHCVVEKRDNAIVNRLNKTKFVKELTQLRAEREERNRLEQAENKQRKLDEKRRTEEEKRRKEQEKRERNYEDLFQPEKFVRTNRDGGSDSDDFM